MKKSVKSVVVILAIVIAVALLIGVVWQNNAKINKEKEIIIEIAQEQGLEDVVVDIVTDNETGYKKAIVASSNFDEFSYERMFEIDDALGVRSVGNNLDEIMTFQYWCHGSEYDIYISSIYRDRREVYVSTARKEAYEEEKAAKQTEKKTQSSSTKKYSSEKTSKNEVSVDSNATLGEKNALKKAKDYLAFTGFSYKGLVEQLEYEGFSNAEATYGADNCGADWKEQALRKAKDYLSFTAFSNDGLIEQLEYEGFTNDEATYGADNCGADWNEEAAKKAEDYLSFMAFSRQDLIDQLMYEGFTHEQAVYGVTACGY